MNAPLNDAAVLFRAQNQNPVPNEGQRTEPMTLANVQFNTDRWAFISTSSGDITVPVSVLNGSVSFAIRYKPSSLWATHGLMYIGDPGAYPLKRFMLYQTTSNKVHARFFDANGVAVGCYTTTPASLTRIDTVVATYDSATNTTKVYLNGVEEGSYTGNPRASVLTAPLQAGGSLTPGQDVYAIASWSRCLSASEVAVLTSNADWLAVGGGAPPPPPPPPDPGELIVKLNGTVQAGATVSIDGVPVEPVGTADKLVEVTF